MFPSRVGIQDLPLNVAFYSVKIDSVLRKNVNEDTSNPAGLAKEFGIGPGETLTICKVLEKTEVTLE